MKALVLRLVIPTILALLATYSQTVAAHVIDATGGINVGQMELVSGTYLNEQFGFSTPSLPGIKAYRSSAPQPNHGIVYVLDDHRKIAVSAEYDATDYGSTRTQTDAWLENETGDCKERKFVKLSGVTAEQVTVVQGQSIVRAILQRRNERGGILYELTLETAQSSKDQDFALLDKVRSQFRRLHLPR